MKVSIIGVGLLGGSFAYSIKEIYPHAQIIAIDSNASNAERAVELGIADKIMSLAEAVPQSKLIILATPVTFISKILSEVLDRIPANGIVIDVGSTKEKICESVANHVHRDRYVATHPIAGTENSGPNAAFKELLPNKIMIICEKEKSAPDALHFVEQLSKQIGMHTRFMSPTAHDLHLAYVSHLSHVISFALSVSVLDKEKNESRVFDMAGSGFASTARLAKSAPSMWVPIFTENKKNISEALGVYIAKLNEFKEKLDNEDSKGMYDFITYANEIRRVLSNQTS
jgi:prephenate dehydrogenase